MELQVEGDDDLRRLGAELKQLGDKQFRTEVFRGLSRAVKPLRQTALKSPHLVPGLPRRGGLAATLAAGLKGRGGVKSKRKLSGRNVGISISGSSSGHDISAMNRGRLRHPVWGRQRGIWVNQSITPGFWDRPLVQEAPKAREDISREITSAFRRIRGA